MLPTFTVPNASVVGKSVTGAKPVPVRVTVCGEFIALSVTETVPVRAPVAVGVNVALIVQVTVLGSVAVPTGQLFVWPKFALAVIEIVVGEVPVFFTVITLAALVSPTAVEEKASEAGVTVTVV